MIKATKEILKNFGIENLFLSGSEESEKWLFQPVELEDGYWICTLDTPCYLATAICNIKINDEYIKIPATIELLEENIYRLEFTDNSNREFRKMKTKINELDKNNSFLEKRKEQRYQVGIKGSIQIGITDHDKQKVIYKGHELPCFFNNISYNGCNITTMQTGMFKFTVGEEIGFKLNLSNPLENIFMQGRICSAALKSPENETHFKFAILSVELYEPPLSWKRRLTDYIKAQEK